MTAGRRRFRLVIQYRGTHFHGWQFQAGVRTVEGVLRDALTPLGEDAQTSGASRTDRGVHAVGQAALVELVTDKSEGVLQRALDARTPRDVVILRCQEVGTEFSIHRDVIEKRYLYRVLNRRDPGIFAPDLHWWVPDALDLADMDEAAGHLLGTHDFSAFQNNSRNPPLDSVRSIRSMACNRQGDWLQFQVIGDGFLYKMVRNLVGTLVEVGRGRQPASWVGEVLRSRCRAESGPTAPSGGLFLMEVRYPGDVPVVLTDELFVPS